MRRLFPQASTLSHAGDGFGSEGFGVCRPRASNFRASSLIWQTFAEDRYSALVTRLQVYETYTTVKVIVVPGRPQSSAP